MDHVETSPLFRRLSLALSLSLALLLTSAAGSLAQQNSGSSPNVAPAGSDPAVAIVGSHIIRESDVQRAMNALRLGDQIDVRSQRARFIDSLVREELMFQLALQKMRESRAARDRVKSAVVGDFIENEVRGKVAVTDEKAREYYDATKENLGGEYILLRDIQFADEATCRAQLGTIRTLEDFGRTAKSFHVLKDLGEDAGEVGTVMTRHVIFGYGAKLAGLAQNKPHLVLHDGKCHIVWISEREIRPVPTFEELRERLVAGLRAGAEAEMLQKVIADARTRIGVTQLTKTEAQEAETATQGQPAQTQTGVAPTPPAAQAPAEKQRQVAAAPKLPAPRAAAPAPGAWQLVNQNGRSVSHTALMGRPAVMAFGFTFCPDICPTTLLEMSNWIDELGKTADKASWSFVSIDPERDTPAVLKSYMENFSGKIGGLTGTPQQLASLVSKYEITVRRVDSKDGGYSMDHSSSVLLLDASGRVTDTIDFGTDAAEAVRKITKLIDAHTKRTTN